MSIQGFNKKEQGVLTDIINLLKYKSKDKSKNITAFNYLYNFLKSMDTHEELKYSLGYKQSIRYVPQFNFNKEKSNIYLSQSYIIAMKGNISKW